MGVLSFPCEVGLKENGMYEGYTKARAGVIVVFNVLPTISIEEKDLGFNAGPWGYVKVSIDMNIEVGPMGGVAIEGKLGSRKNECEDGKTCSFSNLNLTGDLGLTARLETLFCAKTGGIFLPEYDECLLAEGSIQGTFKWYAGYQDNISNCDDEDAKFDWGYEGIYLTVTARFVAEGNTNFANFKFVEIFGPFLTGEE